MFKKVTLIAVLAIVVLIQFIPIDRDNPTATAPLSGPPAVVEVLRQSCYDCHSVETEWPWYSYVAPISWLVADDVEEGRSHLNFSEWEALPDDKKAAIAREMVEETSEGDMPLPIYLWLHGEAELSEQDMQIITGWRDSLVGRPAVDTTEVDLHEGHDH